MCGHPDFSLTRAEAVALLLDNWLLPCETELVPLQESLGRVTARDIFSSNTLPVSRISAVDGIAVRSADFENGMPEVSAWVRNADFAQADTGDDFPDEFDTVIPIEGVSFDDDGKLCFTEEFEYEKNAYIRKPGSMIQSGDLIIPANTRITPMLLSALALGGVYQVEVIRRPKVVYIPTGSELISAGQKPERGKHVETNGLMVSAYLKDWGADTVCFPIIKDDIDSLGTALDTALASADIVLINGGSSKGAEDYNTRLLKSRAEFFYYGMKCRPGRPVAVSLIGGKPVINLPGPSMATFLAMDWCVRNLIYHWLRLPFPKRQTVRARLEAPIRKPEEIEADELIIRLIIQKKGESYLAKPVVHNVSQIISMTAPNAIFVVPIGVSGHAEGEEIIAELLCSEENIREAV